MKLKVAPLLAAILVAGAFANTAVASGSMRAWMMQRRAGQMRGAQASAPINVPAGVKVLHDVRYGSEPQATFDVYIPDGARAAPVVFMVHGGAWRRGDKAASGVVEDKLAHWVPKGIILVSVDYPMDNVPPLDEARYVAKALATAQRDAPQWGGDPAKFVLMGHSAGAHLVSLISAEPSLATSQGARPWLGTVALDSAAYDVTTIMGSRHLRLYDQAFGSDRAAWVAASPTLQVKAKIAPFLGVCSSLRADSCPQAQAFAAKAQPFGSRVDVLPEPLRHSQINAELGQPSAYTASVDRFLASLDPALAARLH